MKQRNSDETDITFILLTKIPMNLTLLVIVAVAVSESFLRHPVELKPE